MAKNGYGLSDANPIIIHGNSVGPLLGMLLAKSGSSDFTPVDDEIKAYFDDLCCPSGATVRYKLRVKTTGDVVHRARRNFLGAVRSASQQVFELVCSCGAHTAVVYVEVSELAKAATAAVEGWSLVGEHARRLAEDEQRKASEEAEKARRAVEEKRIRGVQAKRRIARLCVLCGKSLGLLDRFKKRDQHKSCTVFHE